MSIAPRQIGSPTTCFTGLAQAYARYRPSYPLPAIDFILANRARPLVIADIGCGTGISTRALARDGTHVIGIEPNPDMLGAASAETPASTGSIEYRPGRAEATGLDAASCDLVVCAQAFHWFAGEAALREFHRIIRPGGGLALLWNVKDEQDAFTSSYLRLTHEAQAVAEQSGLIVPRGRRADPATGDWFRNVRRAAFPSHQELDRDGLLGRARSASYFPRHEPERSRMERLLGDLFAHHERQGRVRLAQRAEVTLADRADR